MSDKANEGPVAIVVETEKGSLSLGGYQGAKNSCWSAFDRNSRQHCLDIYFIRRFRDSVTSKDQSRRIYNNPL
jgi:hypothetical protein